MMLLVKAMSIQACHPCQKNKNKIHNNKKDYTKINYQDENNCLPITDAARSVQNVWVTWQGSE